MKPLYKQGKWGLFLFITLTVFSLSLYWSIVNTTIASVLVSVSLFLTSISIFLTIISKDKKSAANK